MVYGEGMTDEVVVWWRTGQWVKEWWAKYGCVVVDNLVGEASEYKS